MIRETAPIPLRGGLNLVTPPMELPPGMLIAGYNYEPLERGYGRISGYERFDGRPRPSDAEFWVMSFTDMSQTILKGALITGADSGAQAFACLDAVDGEGGRSVTLTGLTGEFQEGETFEIGGSAAGVVTQVEYGLQEMSVALHAAIETTRSHIEAVPGSGPVRGVWVYDEKVWAFRDNEAGTACVMYLATADGWKAKSLGHEIRFKEGTDEFLTDLSEGIDGGTSGAFAVMLRIITESGDWSLGTAAGRMILHGLQGVFSVGETITGQSSAGSAKVDTVAVANELPNGGHYRFDNFNFYGSADTYRMYGVNGVGPAFEWDGSAFVTLGTGARADLDKPTTIVAHRNHLFVGYSGGSLQFSGIGNPHSWSVLDGAGEIGFGEEIVALTSMVDGVLGIFGPRRVGILYGSSAADFEMRLLSDDSGAVEHTVQVMGTPIYLDARGVRSLESTQQFGNFSRGTLTQLVEPLVRAIKRGGRKAIASLRIRAKDQYRLFLSDGTGLMIYTGRQFPECCTFDVGSLRAFSSCSDNLIDGSELVFVGGEDGFVYEMERGTSFDGAPIKAFMRLAFNHLGRPQTMKRWHKVVVEADASPQSQITFSYSTSYGNPSYHDGFIDDVNMRGGGGYWNEVNWNQFYWSSQVEGQAETHIDGIGTNLSLVLISEAAYEPPHTIHGLSVEFSPRRLKR